MTFRHDDAGTPVDAWADAHDVAYAAYLRLFDARAAVDEQAALLERMGTA